MQITTHDDGTITITVTAAEAVGVCALANGLDQLAADARTPDPGHVDVNPRAAVDAADLATAQAALADLSKDYPAPAPVEAAPVGETEPAAPVVGETEPAVPVVGETEPAAPVVGETELPGATTAPELTTAEVDATAATPVPAVLAADPAAEAFPSAPAPTE